MLDGSLSDSLSPVAASISCGTEPVWTPPTPSTFQSRWSLRERVAGVDHGLMRLDVQGHHAQFGGADRLCTREDGKLGNRNRRRHGQRNLGDADEPFGAVRAQATGANFDNDVGVLACRRACSPAATIVGAATRSRNSCRRNPGTAYRRRPWHAAMGDKSTLSSALIGRGRQQQLLDAGAGRVGLLRRDAAHERAEGRATERDDEREPATRLHGAASRGMAGREERQAGTERGLDQRRAADAVFSCIGREVGPIDAIFPLPRASTSC